MSKLPDGRGTDGYRSGVGVPPEQSFPEIIMSRSAALLLLLVAGPAFAQPAALLDSIKQREADSWDMAFKIWGWSEVGYKETRSSALLADWLEKAGFTVKRGVARIP